jgi:hypothetical protein
MYPVSDNNVVNTAWLVEMEIGLSGLLLRQCVCGMCVSDGTCFNAMLDMMVEYCATPIH